MFVDQSKITFAEKYKIPVSVDRWLHENIDGDKEKLRRLIGSGEVGTGIRPSSSGYLDDFVFQVYADEDCEKLRIYWNDGKEILVCLVELMYTMTPNKRWHAEHAAGMADSEEYYCG